MRLGFDTTGEESSPSAEAGLQGSRPPLTASSYRGRTGQRRPGRCLKDANVTTSAYAVTAARAEAPCIDPVERLVVQILVETSLADVLGHRKLPFMFDDDAEAIAQPGQKRKRAPRSLPRGGPKRLCRPPRLGAEMVAGTWAYFRPGRAVEGLIGQIFLEPCFVDGFGHRSLRSAFLEPVHFADLEPKGKLSFRVLAAFVPKPSPSKGPSPASGSGPR